MNDWSRLGGLAALYMAAAYLAAIPYFLLVVHYPSVVDPVAKVLLLRDHFAGMTLMHVIVYELVAIALIVLGLALYHRLRAGAPVVAPLATVIGVVWAALLLGSSMVFNYGMGAVVALHATHPDQAVWAWQVIEPVALGLGGSGGELLGGVWILLVSVAAWRTRALPVVLNGLGVLIGVAGLVSVAPPLRDAGIVFGLLHIFWFAGVGVVLLRAPRPAAA